MSYAYLQGGTFFYNEPGDGEKNNRKPDLLKKLVLVLILLLGALIGFAQEDELVPLNCLKVKVKPTIDKKQATGVTMRLYKGEQEVMRIDSMDEGNTMFVLEKNAQYTIEVEAPGRQMRRLSITTALPDDVPVWPLFRYYVDVELPAITPLTNDFYRDFPIALISYNEDKDKFEHSKQYTAHIRKRMQEAEVESTVVNK